MIYNLLGNTGIRVSKVCFGSLSISPLQSNITKEKAVKVLSCAFDYGVNFIDTAEIYENYDVIAEFLKSYRPADVVIATKCYAYTAEMAEKSLVEALKALNRDYIDIFLLHEQESIYTLRGHAEAIEYFMRAKDKGYIRAFGISTHTVDAVKAAATMNEIEVIHPIINMGGIGILGGSREDMLYAIRRAHEFGKGIYAMKALGGGHLIGQARPSIDFVNSIDEISSIAIGMQSEDEVIADVYMVSGRDVPDDVAARLNKKVRKLVIEEWCDMCGACIDRCVQNALRIEGDSVVVDMEKCNLCSYCVGTCPHFYIKVV
ncbi:MAG: aldo/keto reductase [Thermoanaerobacteraceae bacterium]|nr:aldo/keto reductase [Thermoanaerobacteraceae bacterium]